MIISIQQSSIEHLPTINKFYKTATAFQKAKGAVPWSEILNELIVQEIEEQRQWNLKINNQIACVWVVTENDPQIWGLRNKDSALYIHRISTHSDFRGLNLVKEIVKWAKVYSNKNNKKYIRMDTVGKNPELICYYQKCGFDYLGLYKLEDTDGLPNHYNKANVCLFQMTV